MWKTPPKNALHRHHPKIPQFRILDKIRNPSNQTIIDTKKIISTQKTRMLKRF